MKLSNPLPSGQYKMAVTVFVIVIIIVVLVFIFAMPIVMNVNRLYEYTLEGFHLRRITMTLQVGRSKEEIIEITDENDLISFSEMLKKTQLAKEKRKMVSTIRCRIELELDSGERMFLTSIIQYDNTLVIILVGDRRSSKPLSVVINDTDGFWLSLINKYYSFSKE